MQCLRTSKTIFKQDSILPAGSLTFEVCMRICFSWHHACVQSRINSYTNWRESIYLPCSILTGFLDLQNYEWATGIVTSRGFNLKKVPPLLLPHLSCIHIPLISTTYMITHGWAVIKTNAIICGFIVLPSCQRSQWSCLRSNITYARFYCKWFYEKSLHVHLHSYLSIQLNWCLFIYSTHICAHASIAKWFDDRALHVHLHSYYLISQHSTQLMLIFMGFSGTGRLCIGSFGRFPCSFNQWRYV